MADGCMWVIDEWTCVKWIERRTDVDEGSPEFDLLSSLGILSHQNAYMLIENFKVDQIEFVLTIKPMGNDGVTSIKFQSIRLLTYSSQNKFR